MVLTRAVTLSTWELLLNDPFDDVHATLRAVRDIESLRVGLIERVRRLTLEITKYCDIGCTFCKYHVRSRSGHARGNLILSSSAIDECLRYCEVHQVPAMVITGGGEPTYEFDTVLRLIRDSPCHDISLYTAGQWGETTGEAKDILDQLHMANQARESPADIELRLSVDDFHAERLGHRPAVNIIEQYGRHHHALNSIRLTIRTVLGYEAVLSDIGRELDANEVISTRSA